MIDRRRRSRRPFAVWLALPAALAAAGPAGAALDAGEAAELVRTTWYEGIPEDRIEPLAPDAMSFLAGVLADPARVAEHAAALELLGRAGGDGAYELVAAYAAQAPSGSIDAPTYRARLAVPLALGWLARSDDRALSILIAATKGAADATWSYRHMDASRVADLLRRHAGSGLALSRRPEAVARLREMAAEPAAGLGAHAAALLADEHVMGREER